MSQYDYLVVGAGLSGAVFANAAKRAGKSVLVIDRRDHIAGNVYTEDVEGIQVHRYGAHIFHTSMRDVWDYVNRFAEFNNYVNSPVANFRGSMYNMPFNMNTFAKMWPGVVTPADAKAKIAEQVAAENIGEPANLEEQALSLVGRDIFETLVKGYTEKQWGRDCKDLPASIIKRLPCRFTYDNNYFNDRYQGIPMGGYTKMVANMLEGVEVRCGVEYKELAAASLSLARERLSDVLRSYRAMRDCELVLIFDGYRVAGNTGERETHGIRTVYTKENETADMYIERLANDIGKNYSVKVVTNDSLIRLSAMRSGVLRMSVKEFSDELDGVMKMIMEYIDGKR